MTDALRFRLSLDALDDNCAIYEGSDSLSCVISRAAFDGQGMPTYLYVDVPAIEKP